MFDVNTAPGAFAACPDCGTRLRETADVVAGSVAFQCDQTSDLCNPEPLPLADVYLEHDERATVRDGALFVVTVPADEDDEPGTIEPGTDAYVTMDASGVRPLTQDETEAAGLDTRDL